MLGRGHQDLPFLRCEGAPLVTNALYLVVEGTLLIEVAHLVAVGLLFEVLALLVCQCLPLLSYLLHHLQGTHLWMCVDDQRSGLKDMIRLGLLPL